MSNVPHRYGNSRAIWAITQFYLPPGRGRLTLPPLPQPIKAGVRRSVPGGMQGWVNLVSFVTYRGGIPAQRRRSPIPVLTGLNVEQLCSCNERRYRRGQATVPTPNTVATNDDIYRPRQQGSYCSRSRLSVCPSVRLFNLFPLSLSNRLTFDLVMLHHMGHHDHSSQGLKVEVICQGQKSRSMCMLHE